MSDFLEACERNHAVKLASTSDKRSVVWTRYKLRDGNIVSFNGKRSCRYDKDTEQSRLFSQTLAFVKRPEYKVFCEFAKALPSLAHYFRPDGVPETKKARRAWEVWQKAREFYAP